MLETRRSFFSWLREGATDKYDDHSCKRQTALPAFLWAADSSSSSSFLLSNFVISSLSETAISSALGSSLNCHRWCKSSPKKSSFYKNEKFQDWGRGIYASVLWRHNSWSSPFSPWEITTIMGRQITRFFITCVFSSSRRAQMGDSDFTSAAGMNRRKKNRVIPHTSTKTLVHCTETKSDCWGEKKKKILSAGFDERNSSKQVTQNALPNRNWESIAGEPWALVRIQPLVVVPLLFYKYQTTLGKLERLPLAGWLAVS